MEPNPTESKPANKIRIEGCDPLFVKALNVTASCEGKLGKSISIIFLKNELKINDERARAMLDMMEKQKIVTLLNIEEGKYFIIKSWNYISSFIKRTEFVVVEPELDTPLASTEPKNPPIEEKTQETPESDMTYDLSKLSEQTRDKIRAELKISKENLSEEAVNPVMKKLEEKLIHELTHDPIAFFESELKDFREELEALKQQPDIEPEKIARFEKIIQTREEIVADLKKNLGNTQDTTTATPTEVLKTEPTPESKPVVSESIETPINEIFEKVYDPKVVKAPSGKIGFFVHEGVGRDHQEDRVTINTEKDCYASIDGMGGEGNGDKAAQILAETFSYGFDQNLEFNEIHERAHENMKKKLEGNSGACYISFKIKNVGIQKQIYVGQAGDVRLFIIDSEGKVTFETKDEGIGPEVYNSVTGNPKQPGNVTQNFCVLNPGDRIIAASDGLTDNFNTQEIADMIKGMDTESAIRTIRDRANDAMSGKIPDHKIKKDNINVILYDIALTTDAMPETQTKQEMQKMEKTERIRILKEKEATLALAIEKLEKLILALPDDKE